MPTNNLFFFAQKKKNITQNKNLPNFFKNLPKKHKIYPVAESPQRELCARMSRRRKKKLSEMRKN